MAPVVLFADDDQIVRTVVQNALAREGIFVIPASSAEEALEFLAQIHDVDMLVTDVCMGSGMTGIELAERVLTERTALPVLIVSSHLEEPPMVLGRPLPFLPKPFSTEELARRIRTTVRPGTAPANPSMAA